MNDMDDDDDDDDDSIDLNEGIEVVRTDAAVNDCEMNSKIHVMILVLTNSYS